MIIRGTTPKLTFSISTLIDLNNIEEVWITIRVTPKNANKKDKTYYKDDVEINPEARTIVLELSQEDTLDLNASPCSIQLRIKMNDGQAYASEIYEEPVGKVLNNGVI